MSVSVSFSSSLFPSSLISIVSMLLFFFLSKSFPSCCHSSESHTSTAEHKLRVQIPVPHTPCVIPTTAEGWVKTRDPKKKKGKETLKGNGVRREIERNVKKTQNSKIIFTVFERLSPNPTGPQVFSGKRSE